MIRLRFEGMSDAHSQVVGPCEAFRVAGNFLREFPANTVIGNYTRHQWHVRGGHFGRYDAIDPCVVYFADAEGTRHRCARPFKVLHVADGTMYAAEKLFAKFIDETLLWHSFELRELLAESDHQQRVTGSSHRSPPKPDRRDRRRDSGRQRVAYGCACSEL